ncbi:MAG: bifunctional 4-hydroxy-3-methylbut-2-enyl diphosphate reductase/30S ribosomal protein S1 [Christensenellaceae bacterium]|nr:bifunctional 4-hydroxy-3-methylbut-2-enyl diphosphate reductase/30S ribosomal protein S1 [Christensenellaceae bacterium]
MQIILAKNAGFCFGVRRAVELAKSTAYKLRETSSDAVVYTYGELIHNRTVVDELRSEGIIPIQSLCEAKEGDYVIIRSHGVSMAAYDELRERGINYVDATCPFVESIHRIVAAAHERGERVYIVGDPNHPETIGINGFCDNKAVFIRSVKDVDLIADDGGCMVVQTTYDSEAFAEIENMVKTNHPEIKVHNTICNTTLERQREAEELSRKCDIMLVLGDSHSSNTAKLREICKKNCRNTVAAAKNCEISLDILENPDIIMGVVAGASTPDSIIREVITIMSEQDKAKVDCCEAENKETVTKKVATDAANAVQTIEENAVFDEDAITKTIVRIRSGQILTGTVIQIVDGEVSVSIGYKSDGYIPRNEFSNDPELDPASVCKVGDTIDVEVLKVNDGEGNVLLSRKNVESQKAWEKFSADAESEGKILEGTCKEVVKGGVIAILNNGARAFIPASQLSTKYVENLNDYVNKPMKVKVLEVDTKRKRIVASQKAVLLMEAEAAKKAIWESLVVGTKCKGIVRRLTDFGAFVDIGGVDGLVHITQCSYSRGKKPAEVFTVGQEIDVIIREVDIANKRVSLGYKELLPKPWTTAGERYPVGAIVEGKVVRIVSFGAFVSLEPTIDGLVHISQLGLKRVANVEDEVKIGDTIRCKVTDIDTSRRRISLSRREAILEENPEEAAAFFAQEKAERDRVRQERQEKREQEDQARKEAAAAREERRREREERRAAREERRRREEPDYELPPVESATTSLASLLGNFVPMEDNE